MSENKDGTSSQPAPAGKPIRASAAAAPAAARPDANDALPSPFSNIRNNARIAQPAPGNSWHVAWTADLGAGFGSQVVLAVPGRAVVGGSASWALVGPNGRVIAHDLWLPGDLSVDQSNGLLYGKIQNGAIRASRLEDGQTEFILPALYGKEMERVLIRRVGTRMVVASSERLLDLHATRLPENSTIELQEIGRRPATNDVKFVTSAKRLRALERANSHMRVVFDGQTLVMAIPNQITVLDAELTEKAIYTDEFEPLGISMDEGNRIYLLLRVGETAKLWVLTLDGQRLLTTDVPSEFAGDVPPAVGYDHRIYLRGSKGILAVGWDGKKIWEYPGSVAGLLITADSRVLAAVGSRLVAIDGEGKALVLADCGKPLTAGPASDPEGGIFAASDDALFRLSPK